MSLNRIILIVFLPPYAFDVQAIKVSARFPTICNM